MKRKNPNVTNIAYRFLIKPNVEQRIMFAKTFGCCRYIWNRMLHDKTEHYEATKTMLNVTPATYKKDPECVWLNEVDSLAFANVQLELDAAYKSFFKKKSGFPNYKKKGGKKSYTTNNVNNNIVLTKNRLALPKIGSVKIICHREIQPGGKIKSVTITQEPDGKYYAAILFEYAKEDNTFIPDRAKSVGLDMSMKELFISSDGECGDYPHFYRKLQDRIAKEQRKLSHMEKKSNNYMKQKQKIAKLHAKAKHQRMDFLHKTSRSLVNRYDYIFVEDLNMQAMSQALNLGKSVHDNGWGIFVTMLNYKLARKGGLLTKIDKWYPSSKTCCVCGHKNDSLTLSDRIFYCPECGNIVDRDHQAAINILNEGLRMIS